MAISARETLRQLHYDFDSQLQLRHIHTGRPFEFVDQAHYEGLADAVADFIQELLVKDYGMIKVDLPLEDDWEDDEDDEGDIDDPVRCPVFVSANINEADIVLVLLCGSGRVVAGQWARKLCINDSLKTGSVLPFLDWAQKHSFGVIVLNPNKNVVETAEGQIEILYNETSEAHVDYTWGALCKGLPAKHFLLVAHSYGGVSTCNLLEQHGVEVLERLRCIAFTDSVHSERSVKRLSQEVQLFLSKHCINWVSSLEPLDTVIEMWRQKFVAESGQGDECSQSSERVYTNILSETVGKIGSTGNKDERHERFPTNSIEDDGKYCLKFSNAETKGEHADHSELDEAAGCCSADCEQSAEEVGNNACWHSDFNELPGLSEQVTSEKKVSPRRKRRNISDWFGARSSACKVVSAGTDVHEETTMSAFSSICTFLFHSLQQAGAITEVQQQKES